MPDITSPLEDHLARKKNTLTAAVGKGIEAPAPAPVASGSNIGFADLNDGKGRRQIDVGSSPAPGGIAAPAPGSPPPALGGITAPAPVASGSNIGFADLNDGKGRRQIDVGSSPAPAGGIMAGLQPAAPAPAGSGSNWGMVDLGDGKGRRQMDLGGSSPAPVAPAPGSPPHAAPAGGITAPAPVASGSNIGFADLNDGKGRRQIDVGSSPAPAGGIMAGLQPAAPAPAGSGSNIGFADLNDGRGRRQIDVGSSPASGGIAAPAPGSPPPALGGITAPAPAAQGIEAAPMQGSGFAQVGGKKVDYSAIGTTSDPLAKGFDGSGIVKGQATNSNGIIDGMIARQGEQVGGAKYQDEVNKAIRVNAANGIVPGASQMKTVGMSLTDETKLLSDNNRTVGHDKNGNPIGVFDKQIAAGMETARAENEKKVLDAELTGKAATAEWYRARAGALNNKGTGITGHVIKDPDSPTGWSYADQNGNIAATGAPDPSTKKMDMNKLSDEEQTAINKAVTEKRLDPYKVNSRNQKTLAGIEIAHPGTDLNSISGNLGVARNKDVIMKAGVADMLPGLVQNVVTVGKALNYSDTQFVGKVQQLAQGQLNDPRLVEYMTARNDLLLTLGGVMRGNGMTDMAQKLEEQAAHPTMSPKALDGWMKGQMASIDPRLKLYHSLISGKGLPGTEATATDTPAHSPQAAQAGITGESPQRLGERVGKDLKRGASKEATMHALMDLGYSDSVISQALKFAQGGK